MSNLKQPTKSGNAEDSHGQIEANPTSGTGIVHGRLTAVAASVAHGFSHLNSQGISVLYPVLREQFAFGYTGIALLSVVQQLASGPTQITFGVLTQFLRRVRIMAIGTALAFIGVIVMVVSQNYGQLLAGKAIRGLGTSPNHPVGGSDSGRCFNLLLGLATGYLYPGSSPPGCESPVLLAKGTSTAS